MFSLPRPKLDDVLPSTVRKICLLVHVLGPTKIECLQFVSCSNGEVQDHQRLHEAVRGRPSSVGFDEPRHVLQAIRPSAQFFHSLSLKPLTSIDELF